MGTLNKFRSTSKRGITKHKEELDVDKDGDSSQVELDKVKAAEVLAQTHVASLKRKKEQPNQRQDNCEVDVRELSWAKLLQTGMNPRNMSLDPTSKPKDSEDRCTSHKQKKDHKTESSDKKSSEKKRDGKENSVQHFVKHFGEVFEQLKRHASKSEKEFLETNQKSLEKIFNKMGSSLPEVEVVMNEALRNGKEILELDTNIQKEKTKKLTPTPQKIPKDLKLKTTIITDDFSSIALTSVKEEIVRWIKNGKIRNVTSSNEVGDDLAVSKNSVKVIKRAKGSHQKPSKKCQSPARSRVQYGNTCEKLQEVVKLEDLGSSSDCLIYDKPPTIVPNNSENNCFILEKNALNGNVLNSKTELFNCNNRKSVPENGNREEGGLGGLNFGNSQKTPEVHSESDDLDIDSGLVEKNLYHSNTKEVIPGEQLQNIQEKNVDISTARLYKSASDNVMDALKADKNSKIKTIGESTMSSEYSMSSSGNCKKESFEKPVLNVEKVESNINECNDYQGKNDFQSQGNYSRQGTTLLPRIEIGGIGIGNYNNEQKYNPSDRFRQQISLSILPHKGGFSETSSQLASSPVIQNKSSVDEKLPPKSQKKTIIYNKSTQAPSTNQKESFPKVSSIHQNETQTPLSSKAEEIELKSQMSHSSARDWIKHLVGHMSDTNSISTRQLHKNHIDKLEQEAKPEKNELFSEVNVFKNQSETKLLLEVLENNIENVKAGLLEVSKACEEQSRKLQRKQRRFVSIPVRRRLLFSQKPDMETLSKNLSRKPLYRSDMDSNEIVTSKRVTWGGVENLNERSQSTSTTQLKRTEVKRKVIKARNHLSNDATGSIDIGWKTGKDMINKENSPSKLEEMLTIANENEDVPQEEANSCFPEYTGCPCMLDTYKTIIQQVQDTTEKSF